MHETWTVGGAISGYCATGKAMIDASPPIVITIDSTAAKIGRSMKNRESTRGASCYRQLSVVSCRLSVGTSLSWQQTTGN